MVKVDVELSDEIKNIPLIGTPELGYLLEGKINRYHLTATLMSLIGKGVLKQGNKIIIFYI